MFDREFRWSEQTEIQVAYLKTGLLLRCQTKKCFDKMHFLLFLSVDFLKKTPADGWSALTGGGDGFEETQ